ncbi:MAG: hypothetical protein LZF86_10034 [Nitrospira sp.]|nr:MAG: hypothetical protein LZF86_10034 [Nitrospira sp.]
MRYRSCPQCRQHSLYSNGAFWTCGGCGYAVTESALSLDEGRAMRVSQSALESSR